MHASLKCFHFWSQHTVDSLSSHTHTHTHTHTLSQTKRVKAKARRYRFFTPDVRQFKRALTSNLPRSIGNASVGMLLWRCDQCSCWLIRGLLQIEESICTHTHTHTRMCRLYRHYVVFDCHHVYFLSIDPYVKQRCPCVESYMFVWLRGLFISQSEPGSALISIFVHCLRTRRHATKKDVCTVVLILVENIFEIRFACCTIKLETAVLDA